MAEQSGGKSGFTKFMIWFFVILLLLYLLLGPIFNIVSRWKQTDKWSFEGSDLNPMSSVKSISKVAETFTGKSCKTGDDCATEEGKLNCVENKCQECGNNDQCAGNAHGNLCVENECVECSKDKDCKDAGKGLACDDNKCFECTKDEQCVENGKGKACVDNKCVLCDDDKHCPSGNVCDREKRQCVECIKNSDCSKNPQNKLCLVEQNTCVQCLTDGNCGSGVCIDNACKECRDNTQCQDGFECKSNKCEETTFHSLGGWKTISIGGVLFIGIVVLFIIFKGQKITGGRKSSGTHPHGGAPAAPSHAREEYR